MPGTSRESLMAPCLIAFLHLLHVARPVGAYDTVKVLTSPLRFLGKSAPKTDPLALGAFPIYSTVL